jgi:hypothetical protein
MPKARNLIDCYNKEKETKRTVQRKPLKDNDLKEIDIVNKKIINN